jgi:uncharacterized protein (DUF1684 family)
VALPEPILLLDWKRSIAELYVRVRELEPHASWSLWVRTRDELFARHPQSPLPEDRRAVFHGLSYFDYDPRARVLAVVEEAAKESFTLPTSGNETVSFERCARARFELDGHDSALDLYWLTGYGGGLFLPFRDATSGEETYGAGRYVLDTVKGADLGMSGDRLVIDFNFAYNPSCSYDPRWVCPLAPPANRLPISVRAGERDPG